MANCNQYLIALSFHFRVRGGLPNSPQHATLVAEIGKPRAYLQKVLCTISRHSPAVAIHTSQPYSKIGHTNASNRKQEIDGGG